MRDLPYQAIVLKMRHNHGAVILFDRELGRINAKIQTSTISLKNLRRALMQGGLISYDMRLMQERSVLIDAELIQLPHAWASKDILFLHHVLELALFFIPEHNRCIPTFELCLELYDQVVCACITHKRLFLMKFFIRLGIYPEQSSYRDMQQIFKVCYEIEKHQLAEEQLLLQWLLDCIATHPFAHKLHTMSFLQGNTAFGES